MTLYNYFAYIEESLKLYANKIEHLFIKKSYLSNCKINESKLKYAICLKKLHYLYILHLCLQFMH